VTFALFCYNQQEYILEAIAGALGQTYQPLEIIVSDDCSSDRSFEIIREALGSYSGPHSIRLNRNATTLGIGAHINKVITMARGGWIVGAAGDDISVPQRTEKLIAFVGATSERIFSIWSGCQLIDENGQPIGRLPGYGDVFHSDRSIISGPIRPRGASHMFRRELFEYFGPIQGDVVHEDICLPYRALLLGRVAFLDEDLVMYRRSRLAISNSGRVARSVTEYNQLSPKFNAIVASYLQMLSDLIEYERTNPGYLGSRRGLYHYRKIIDEIRNHRSIAGFCGDFPYLSLLDVLRQPSVFAIKLVIKSLRYRVGLL
jgi:glycosyltransferase involved in cell wall biosynthesis